ncbi:OLC1v1031965C1 [Oldenlandia corymbosa var. corymbosa]|uniref:OLC1v1031965C1 n=1 Tax=Oldenlandia corymbosa var. corymbosa TaxID=529605 RepID=A0AAV1CN18_OLDCO|nr:OLC1v1031965C1 [Oldenlandia corymbosa var. corymbosa]
MLTCHLTPFSHNPISKFQYKYVYFISKLHILHYVSKFGIMKESIPMDLALYLAIFFGLWVSQVVYSVYLKPKKLEKLLRQQGIKGTSYNPIHGDNLVMQEMANEALSKPMSLNHNIVPRVNPFVDQMVQKYGNICLCWRGTRPTLIIAEAELMKMILSDKDGLIQKPPANPFVALLSLGLSNLEGQKWAKRRRLINPAFHHQKLLGMVPEFIASCGKRIDYWKKLVDSSSSAEGTEIDVSSELHSLSADVIARTAFGSSYEEGKKIFQLQQEQAFLINEAFHSLYFPGLRFIPTKKNRRRYEVDKEIKDMLREIVNKKKRAMLDGESSGDTDLLGLLLQCKEKGNEMSMDDVIEECKLFYFAGHETTANWLTWTLICLAIHPEWQEKARQEVLQICGDKTPDADVLNRLKIVTMVLNEVLRLYPLVVNLWRYTARATRIGGITIPAGVELNLPTVLLHHSSEYWGDDAQEFKPERFAEGVSKATIKDQATAFYPFGWGSRICIGQNFANIEAKLALSMILQNFSFKLSPSYVHAPYTIISLQPQHGAPLIFQKI